MSPQSLDLIAKPNEHAFAPFVRILGKGKTGSRSLTRDEARTAMRMILRGERTGGLCRSSTRTHRRAHPYCR
jgi:hypothetical protein